VQVDLAVVGGVVAPGDVATESVEVLHEIETVFRHGGSPQTVLLSARGRRREIARRRPRRAYQ
jgi:hypothetical protein